MGVEDVIGQQAQNAGSQVEQLLGAFGASILGLTLQELTSLGMSLEHALQTFFSGLLGFLGDLNPMNVLFSIADAANHFVQNILLSTQGFVDFLFLLGNPLGIGTGNLTLPTDLSQIPILAPILTLLETVGEGFDQLLTLLGLPTPEAVVAYLEGFAPIASIISALSGAGSGLSGLLAALAEIPGGNIAGALNTAVTVAGKAIGTIVTNIDAAGNLLAAGITGGLTSAVTVSSHAITTLLQYLDSLGRFDATHLVGDIVNSLTYGGTALSTFFQNINSSGGLLAAGVTGGLTSAVTVAGTAITTLVTNIDAAGNFAVTALSGLGSGVLTFLQATLAGAAATFLGVGTLPYTLLTGLGSGISTFLGGSISAIAQTLASSGTLAVTALSGLGTNVSTFLQATLAGGAATFLGAGTLPYTLLTGLGSGVLTFLGAALAGAAATFLVAGVLPFALLSGLDSSVSSFLAGVVSSNAQTLATGGTLTGTALTGAINTAVTISGNAISTLFSGSGVLASALTGAINTGVTISGNAISALFNSSGLLGSAITGTISDTLIPAIGDIRDAITGITNATQIQLAAWSDTLLQFLADWASALNLVGVLDPNNLIEMLSGLFPAAIPQFNGSVIPADVEGFIDNLNGTISYFGSQAQDNVNSLIQQTDGSWATVAQIMQNQAEAALAAGAASTAAALAAGHQVAEQIVGAFDGVATQAEQAVGQVGDTISSAITSWVSSWLGLPTADPSAPPAAAPELSAAALQAAAQAAALAARAAAIEAQIPALYGGTGTAGLNDQVPMTTTLPATFTTVSPGQAGYNTPFVTDSQAVSGVWKTSDGFARYLWLRGNLAGTTRVYAKLQTGTDVSEIGCYVAGVKTVLTTFSLDDGDAVFQANAAYNLEATDYSFEVVGPDGSIIIYDDSLHVSQKGVLYVYGGFGSGGKKLTTWSRVNPAGHPVYSIPTTLVYGDKLAIAAEGAGAGGSWLDANTGSGSTSGGGAASWVGELLTYGVDIPLSTTAITVGQIGRGGAAAVKDTDIGYGVGIGAPGTSTSITIPGYGTYVSPGGIQDAGEYIYGEAAGDATFDGVTYYGGANNETPGGGGDIGYSYLGTDALVAQPGGNGGAYITPVSLSTALPGGMVSFTIFDTGSSSGPEAAYVPGTGSTASDTYVDVTNTNDQVTINVGPSGLVLLGFYVYVFNPAGETGIVNFAASGANTITPDAVTDAYGIYVGGHASDETSNQMSAVHLIPNLAEGATTFKMKYRAAGAVGADFSERRIWAVPL